MSAKSVLQPGERVAADDPRLFNINDLACAMGVNRAYVTRMKALGFRMPLGKATVGMAHSWLNENAEMLSNPEKTKRSTSEVVA